MKHDEKHNESKICDKDREIRYCKYEFCPEDSPTKINNLGTRILYISVIWFIMLWNQPDDVQVFTNIVLFYIPLLMDYCKFNNKNNIRKIIRSLGIATCVFWLIFSLFGYIGIIQPINNSGKLIFKVSEKYELLTNFCFSYKSTWKLMGISVFWSVLDKFVFENKIEKDVINNLNSSNCAKI